MKVSSVAGVDHRHAGIERRRHGSAFHGMPYGENVGIAAEHRDGVLEAFALGDRSGAGIVEPDDFAAQPEHCRLKGHLGARGRLIEERRHQLVPACAAVVGRMPADPARHVNDIVQLFQTELIQVNQISYGHFQKPPKLSGQWSVVSCLLSTVHCPLKNYTIYVMQRQHFFEGDVHDNFIIIRQKYVAFFDRI